MAQTLYLRSVQSTVVTGTTTCKQLSQTEGTAVNTGTTVKQAKTVATFQFIPGTAANTTTLTPGTAPNTNGWIFDGQPLGSYAAGTWTVNVDVESSSASGTLAVKASLWIVTATTTAVTSVSQLANAVSTATFTPTTGFVSHSLTFNPGAITLTAGQFLYCELYLTQSVAGSSTTGATTLALDLTADNGTITTPAFTAAPAPLYVQFWTAIGSPTVPETSQAITCSTGGSGAANPTAGNTLVALVFISSLNAASGVNTPTGWALRGSVDNAAFEEGHLAIFTFPVATTGSVSVTFTFTNGFCALWVVEVSSGTFDIVTSSSAAPTATPWASPTGTGTQTGLNDLGLIIACIDDGSYNANALTGYTTLSYQFCTGDGGTTSYGGQAVVLYSNAAITASSVPSQNVGWSTGASGTEYTAGMQILLQYSAAVVFTPYQPNYQRAPILAQ